MRIEQLIVDTFSASQAQVLSAQDIVNDINAYTSVARRIKLSTLSSKLKKMVDEFKLLRVKGYGPRGGYGYLLNPNYKFDDFMCVNPERQRQDNASGPGN